MPLLQQQINNSPKEKLLTFFSYAKAYEERCQLSKRLIIERLIIYRR